MIIVKMIDDITVNGFENKVNRFLKTIVKPNIVNDIQYCAMTSTDNGYKTTQHIALIEYYTED